ncbi:MAG: 50S ribosomal protein L1 [Acidobacteriota bacterium]
MPRAGKNHAKAAAEVEKRAYPLDQAISLLKKIVFAKFNETVEVSMRLGVDPKHADQMVRGTVVLPNGLGKSRKVVTIASGEKVKEARDAGSDEVGGEDIVERIAGGWMDFDAVVATPDMMRSVGKLGKILGPRGLMPNPKTGTVTFEVAKAVRDIKAGKVEFRVDKTGSVHGPVGKIQFEEKNLLENARAFIDAVLRAKPPTSKGKYVRSISLSSTMSPGIVVDEASIESRA